jgi:hypothetical protein
MDIFTDALGGALAYIYFVQRKRNTSKPVGVIHPFFDQIGAKKVD